MPPLDILPNVLIVLITAVLVVGVFRKINLSPVLGYFVAGSVIGPYGLGVLHAEDTKLLGEVGIVFLLFAIGLELTLERLKSMRVHVFGFGSLQVIVTASVIATIVYFLGYASGPMLVVGGGLALSSTAIVLQVIAEQRKQSTQIGRLSLAVLLLQDFAVVPLLVLIPLLSGSSDHLIDAIAFSLLKAVIALVGIFVIGRLFLRPVYHIISSANPGEHNELYVATTILIALGAAWTTEHFGLSMALGAFVAGVMVAETEYQHQAEESIAPFKGLLLGLFFMTVGMTINLDLMVKELPTILLLSVGLMAVKATIITSLCLLFRFSLGSSIHSGLLLSQGGEFGFILFTLASKNKIISPDLEQNLLLTITITMAVTPIIAALGQVVAEKLDAKKVLPKEEIIKQLADLNDHVIICGAGRVGKMVARLLETENVGYVSIDMDPRVVEDTREAGYPVYLGDSSNMETMKILGVERAQSVIISFENDVMLAKTVKNLRTNFPDLPIIVRAEDLVNAPGLYNIGVTKIVPGTYETGLQLGGAVLKSVGISDFEVSRIKNRFRAGNYLSANLEEDEEDTD